MSLYYSLVESTQLYLTCDIMLFISDSSSESKKDKNMKKETPAQMPMVGPIEVVS